MKTDTNVMDDLLRRPYTRVLRQDEDGDYIARIDELPGCVAHGATVEAALERLTEMQRLWLEDALESGDEIPDPAPDPDQLPSGKWLQRVPRTMHQRLIAAAKADRVSLNQFVTTALAEALGTRKEDSRVLAKLQSVVVSCLRSERERLFALAGHGGTGPIWNVHQTRGRYSDANALTLISSITGHTPGNEEQENVFYGVRGSSGYISGLPEKRPAKRRWP